MEDAEDSDVPERFRPLLKTFPGEMDLRQKLYPDVSAIEDSKIQCTICLKDVKHVFLLKKKTYKHFFLQVVVCKSCMKFYGNGDFSAESDGDDKYCRWCGQGGKLYLCSKCPTAFCKKCIKQNLERKFVLKVENDNWLCFVCDPTPLFKLRALSWAIDKHLENEKKKEEAENSRKREAPKAPRPRTVKIPKIEFEEDKFRHNVDSSRLWLSGIVDKARSPANDTDFNSIHKDVNSMASVSDFERIVSALVACLDAKLDAIVELKGQLASGVQKLVETIGQKEKTVGKNKGQKFRSKHCQDEVTAVKDSAARAKSTTVNSNQEQPKKKESAHNDNSSDSEASSTRNGLDTTKDPGAETRLDDIFDGDTTIPPSDLDNSCTDMFCEDEAKPVIRLRNLSDLIDPKLKSKKTPEKTKAAVKTKKLQEKPKPKEDPDITIISSDDDRPPKPKKHTKKVVNKEDRKPKITTSTPKVALCSKTTVEKTDDSLSDEETLVSNPKHRKLSLATKEHAKKSDEDLTDVPGGSTVSNTSKGLKESKSSKNSLEGKDLDKDPTSPLSNHSSTSRKSKDAAQPLFFSSTDDENPTDEEPQKPTENSKKKIIKEKETQSTKKTKGEPPVTIEKAAPKVISGTSSSSSSSDPLSEGSSDDGKKKKRSVRQDSDSSQEKTKSKVRRSKKPAADLATDDSDDDGKAFLKKEKKLNKRDKTDKAKKLASKAAKKRPLEEDSASDYDISKLCDLKSLRATAGNCSVSSDEDEEPESKTTNVTKKRKANNNEDKLSDFFDSGDDKLNSEEEKEEDLNDVFKREFSHLTNGSVTHDDILGDILKMSSGSENEDKSPPLSGSEESAPSKKSKKDLNKAEKSKTQKEQSANHKGKKKYADKLMKMKIDSTDSDDVDAGLEKYNKAKAKQAEKKHESSDEEPVVTKAPKKGKKKANKKKKMFSDSDESPIEDAESEKESDKDGSNASGSDDDKKRKKSGSESDSSAATKKKKRRRIRAATSDESETDSEGGGRRRKKKDPNESSKGRKSIRKILKEDDLKKTTQEALKAEQERKKRIKEKQELYNKMVVKENTEAPKELTELVLDFDPKTKETILCVDKDLVKKLKPHQAQGIKFMWDSCFETVKMAKTKTGSGCILAHCMGLGKSLQVVTLVHTLITNPDTGVRKVLVVAPLSTVLNWVNEFDKWLSDIGSGQDVNVFHMNKVQTAHRTYLLKDWDRNGGVLIMGYNLLRNLSNAKAKFSKAAKKVFQENLVDPGAFTGLYLMVAVVDSYGSLRVHHIPDLCIDIMNECQHGCSFLDSRDETSTAKQ